MSVFIVASVDLVDIRINLRVFGAIGGELFHEILGVLGDTFELDGTVVAIVAIGELAISDGAQGRCSSLRVLKGAVYLPSGAFQRFAGGIRLVPLDGRAVGGHLAVPREVVTLLVHVKH